MKYALYHGHFINSKYANRKDRYKCPLCHRRVILHREKLSRRTFFVHKTDSRNTYDPAETREHLTGKRQLFDFFNPAFRNVKVEKYLPQINQWPDLIFNKTAIEFQCSPISIKRLKERISGYTRLGIKSWWILGSPYYKRRLRSTYLARFINYSKKLGFFILFWRVRVSGMEIHYQIREAGGHVNYESRLFFRYVDLVRFLGRARLRRISVSGYQFTRLIRSEIRLNQKRLFHGDVQLLKLQSRINPFHNSLMGCPLICHYPSVTFPVFRQKALLWRIRIIILLNRNSSLGFVYHQANAEFKLPLTFCQISRPSKFYWAAFINFIRVLRRFRYLRLSYDGKKVTGLKEPRWFNSVYDKINFLINSV